MIVNTARTHRARRVGVHMRAATLRGARRMRGGIRVRRAGRGNRFVYGVRAGRVRYVGLASRRIARRPAALRRYLRLAGVR